MPRFAFLLLLAASPAFAAEPEFASKVVSPTTPGHAVEVDVELGDAKNLYLVVNDAGDGFGCDWADWVDPRLVSADGEKTLSLTELKWKSAKVGWGQPRVNANAGGQGLRVDGKKVEKGLGVHANSLLHYEIPEGYARFRAKGAVDDGGTNQGCGSTVKFLVYTEKPPATALAASEGNGELGNREPEDALLGLDVGEGLEASVFAAEPVISNPTNVAVDHRGRVWVCEAVNYRHRQGSRPEGDRIVVLEDTDGDGRSDKETVFFQEKGFDSPHGICVLPTVDDEGTRAIVSIGDSVFVFTDTDGDLKADEKRTLFTGISGTQHDHGIHAFVFGPDGRLYFNFGNYGRQLKTPDGKPVVDRAGNVVAANRNPYQEGMVFRCNLDGSEVETLGWNFRNNWELAVDSFGTIWQSDNDDDGNRGVRINYVMEYGNFGYKDELTGAGWKSPRTGMHEEIPERHWHLNDPGVVPNLLQTGAGSPTGICVYEGRLLPERFFGELIHCDAGPNVCRAYLTKKDGAGYSAEIENVLHGARDRWFRPSDVCVAPDGSLIVADWYDPGVGGHRAGDVDRGRLFRITPEGHEGYAVPEFDLSTAESAAEALTNPNLSVRYTAWTALREMGTQAEPALKTLWESNDPRMRARALWLLAMLDGKGEEYVRAALADADPDIRITGLRAARRIRMDLPPLIAMLDGDPSVAVRRECAIALAEVDAEQAAPLWAKLAFKHDGRDRWYLEALGIGARGKWDACFSAWRKLVGDGWNSPGGRDIVWRARTPLALPLLQRIVLSEETGATERLRYFRALDFHGGPEKAETLRELALAGHPDQAAITSLAVAHGAKLDPSDPEAAKAIDAALEQLRGTDRFVELVDALKLKSRYPDLLAIAQEHPADALGVRAVTVLMDADQHERIEQAIRGEDREAALATIEVIGNSGNGKAVSYLMPLMNDGDAPLDRRRAALAAVSKVRNGALRVVELARKNELPTALQQTAAVALHSAQWRDVKEQADELFPPPPSKNDEPLPPLDQLVQMQGDAKRGRVLFNTTATCAKCHQVNGFGKEVGPDLSEIGKKLGREALFHTILFPSAGISHNYETHVVVLESGNVVNGIVTSRTDDAITIKGADAIAKTFETDEIEAIQKQSVSLMPADLQKVMTAEELVDVVEYLETLKQKTDVGAAK